MLTAFWPVLGISVATVTAGGRMIAVIPEDEYEFARGAACEVRTFSPASLDRIVSSEEALVEPLDRALGGLHLGNARIGCEALAAFVPAPYVSVHTWGDQLLAIVRQLLPNATVAPADGLLARLRSVLSARELDSAVRACRVAADAFAAIREHLRAGITERELAAYGRARLSQTGAGRAGGSTYCMSGPHAADAYRAFQHSTERPIMEGDLVLIHRNSFVNGYWTDITRTYCLGRIDGRLQDVDDSVLAARDRALAEIVPGVSAAAVDAAARAVIQAHGYSAAFKHSLGHVVAASDHNAIPRLHPESDHRMEFGMMFNIEPTVYFAGWGGIRHCDVVAVTDSGATVLTPFDSDIQSLCVP